MSTLKLPELYCPILQFSSIPTSPKILSSSRLHTARKLVAGQRRPDYSWIPSYSRLPFEISSHDLMFCSPSFHYLHPSSSAISRAYERKLQVHSPTRTKSKSSSLGLKRNASSHKP